jgi:iron(III) transport system permease protein
VILERERRAGFAWTAAGIAAALLLPWYAIEDGFWRFAWLRDLSAEDSFSVARYLIAGDRIWLAPPLIALGAAVAALQWVRDRRHLGLWLAGLGCFGLAAVLVQGFAIGLTGWSADWLGALAGGQDWHQVGMGVGGVATLGSLLFIGTTGMAYAGWFRGDAFVSGSLGAIAFLVALFSLFPLAKILAAALQTSDGALSLISFLSRLSEPKIWTLACLGGGGHQCGVAWNTLALALLTASGTTLLGLAFALVVTRSALRGKRLLRGLTILPIITPPFVIGLALILLFGRAGLINQLLTWAFDIPPARWIYGLQGVWLAQMFAFTPIAFLILIGVVQSVSPTLEEAAQTLRADPWTPFRTISLPLMRPGLANAFLVGFIESIADFGNAILLGGNFPLLSTDIYFSVVGAQYDQGRAGALSLVLLALALATFLVQRKIVGKARYTAISGKGDAGLPIALPRRLRALCLAITLPWAGLTLAIYAIALVGGFAQIWGRDYTLTLRHYAKAFSLEVTGRGIQWTGGAWNSLWATLEIAAIAAPLTAAIGILTAYLLSRQRFLGRGAFEFACMLSFAIPGTVIGVSYILAFNVPPFELTGTGLILVICLIFRNMPVGVRSGIASMSQIDAGLDEASLTLGGRSGVTFRRVILPLLGPAVVSALVYSFVRGMTTISAIVFLASGEYEMATVYIINRVINGDYGVAIAYGSVLIALMAAVITLIERVVGSRRLGRRLAAAPAPALHTAA